MNAIDLLAYSLNIRSDQPNQELANEIIRAKRTDWVKELVENLSNKNKNIQSDCIKTLYEIGEQGAAELIAPYCNEFGQVLRSKNNRLIWGAMTALDTIALLNPGEVYELLPDIMFATDNGSVITIDHGVGILAKLSCCPAYAENAFPLLIEQLKKCPAKQLPMYAEKAIIAITVSNAEEFRHLIENRLPEMERETQKIRLNKVLKKISKI